MTDEIKIWCPQCGPNVDIDEDGLCIGCGCTAVGAGVNLIYTRLNGYQLELNTIEEKNDELIDGVEVVQKIAVQLERIADTLDRIWRMGR